MLPLVNTVRTVVSGAFGHKWVLATAAAAALAAPGVAGAHDRYDYPDRNRHVEVDLRIGDRGPRYDAPVRYEERQTRVWVPPVYRTVADRRWIEPVYQTVCEQVLVPDVWESREVRRYDHGRSICRVERALVTPAHYEKRDRQVCVSEGRWEICDRQELVCDGHYETRVERVACAPPPVSPFSVVNPGLAIRVGR